MANIDDFDNNCRYKMKPIHSLMLSKPGMRLLTREYFCKNTGFKRYQDITDGFVEVHKVYELEGLNDYDFLSGVTFVSHRWMSANNPDPDNIQYNIIKNSNCELVFYDFSSLPQEPRNNDEDMCFKYYIKQLQTIIEHNKMYVIMSDDYFQRGWCFVEFVTGYNKIINKDEIKTDYFQYPELIEWLTIRDLQKNGETSIGKQFEKDFGDCGSYNASYDAYYLTDIRNFYENDIKPLVDKYVENNGVFKIEKYIKHLSGLMVTNGADMNKLLNILQDLLRL